MNVVRALLVMVWLVMAATATSVHAAPVHDCAMPGMAHHAPAPSDPGVMPCCSQPVVLATPAPMAPVVCKILRMQTFPSLIAVLAGRAIAAEPKPPKLLDA